MPGPTRVLQNHSLVDAPCCCWVDGIPASTWWHMLFSLILAGICMDTQTWFSRSWKMVTLPVSPYGRCANRVQSNIWVSKQLHTEFGKFPHVLQDSWSLWMCRMVCRCLESVLASTAPLLLWSDVERSVWYQVELNRQLYRWLVACPGTKTIFICSRCSGSCLWFLVISGTLYLVIATV